MENQTPHKRRVRYSGTHPKRFEEIFRMLFLEYCGVDTNLIREKFLKNTPIKITLKNVFDIE